MRLRMTLVGDSFEYEEPNEIPGCLWADGTEKPGEPGREIDAVAEYVELQRLTKMNVLRAANHADDHRIQKTLTTRFVFDWRLKPYDQKHKALASKSTFGGKSVCV